jgi:hypothetical protein
MSLFRWVSLTALGAVFMSGCSDLPDPTVSHTPSEHSSEALEDVSPELQAKIRAALAKLSEADQALARAQRYCPVQKALLGTMGKPIRIEIEGQPVFLCCAACTNDARSDPKNTLKLVAQFKKHD